MVKQPAKTKVVYIASQERSGSTLISQILGQIEGFFSVGELYILWRYGLLENRLCGCGDRMHDCEFWQDILVRGNLTHVDPEAMFQLSRKLVRYFPWALLPGGSQIVRSRLGSYPKTVERLYQTVQATTGSRVIVDASKSIVHYYLLSQLPNIDLYMIHLVRDPHGVEYSLRKHKMRGRPECMDHTLLKGSIAWTFKNFLMEWLGQQQPQRYLRVNYEQFVHQPKSILRQVCHMLHEDASALPFTESALFQVTRNHVVAGSAQRFRSGVDQLKLDETWKIKLNARDKAAVTGLTWPLLARYGYAGARTQRSEQFSVT